VEFTLVVPVLPALAASMPNASILFLSSVDVLPALWLWKD